MSKRQRHKKKKKLKLQKKISQFGPATGLAIESMPETIEEIPPVEGITKTPVEEERSKSIINAPTRKFIAKDVKMIIFTLLGLALILTVVKILSLKTGYIDSFGDWLYKITNIQTL